MTDRFYTDTAFTPDKWDGLAAPREIGHYSSTEQERRKFQLPKGIYIDESLARTPIEVIDILKDEKELKESIGEGEWYEFGWATLHNPQHRWELIYYAFKFYLYAAVATVILIAVIYPEDIASGYIELLSLVLVPFLVMKFTKYMTGRAKNKNNIGFNRKTGMVSISRKGQTPFVAPFDEFIPYFYPHHILHGVNYHLYLGHRMEEIGVVNPNAGKHEQEMYVDWAIIQRFMDVSKPLPDIPLYEPFRQLDPTTKTYDAMTGRPEHYWRDMDLKKGEKLQQAAYKRMRAFPVYDQSQWREVPLEYTQWPAIQNL